MCLFRDPKMIDRFCILIQHVTRFCVQQLKNLKDVLEKARRSEEEQANEEQQQQQQQDDKDEDPWSVNQTEMLLQFMAKIFIQMFPLYLGPKQVRGLLRSVCTVYIFLSIRR